MKGKDNKIEYNSGLMELGFVAKNTLEMVEELIKIVAEQQDHINKLEEQIDYMAIRIGKLEENQKQTQESEYPVFTPDKYNFSNEAE